MIVSPPSSGRGYHNLSPQSSQAPGDRLRDDAEERTTTTTTTSPQQSLRSSQAPPPRPARASSPNTSRSPLSPSSPPPPPSLLHNLHQPTQKSRASSRQRAASTSAAVTAVAGIPLIGIPQGVFEGKGERNKNNNNNNIYNNNHNHNNNTATAATTTTTLQLEGERSKTPIHRKPVPGVLARDRESIDAHSSSQTVRSPVQERSPPVPRKEGQGLRQAGQTARRPSQGRLGYSERQSESPLPRRDTISGDFASRGGPPPSSGRKASVGHSSSEVGYNPREGRRQAGVGVTIAQSQYTQAQLQDMSSGKGGKKFASQSFKLGYSNRPGEQSPQPSQGSQFRTPSNPPSSTAPGSSPASSSTTPPQNIPPAQARSRAASTAAGTSSHLIADQLREREQQTVPQGTVREGPVFKYEIGRRWLRDPTIVYPLPVDLPEVHRQSLRLVLLMRLFGAPFCNDVLNDFASDSSDSESEATSSAHPPAPRRQSQARHKRRSSAELPPLKVLDVGCGSGLWSSACADWFRKHTRRRVQFTGLDIAPLAPDLNSSNMSWRYVQHDIRMMPWPFPTGEFDLVFIKDVAFCTPNTPSSTSTLLETGRLVKPGGVLEIWEADHVFRTLLPNPQQPPGTSDEDAEQAAACGAFVMNSSTPFASSQNRFLTDYNAWVESAFTKRGLSAAPCTLVEWSLRVEEDRFQPPRSKRLAIPFGETRWEREAGKALSSFQLSLRRVALLTSVQFIDALEHVLKVESEKSQDEWDRWWAAMASDLLDGQGTSSGECLEVGVWWCRKAYS